MEMIFHKRDEVDDFAAAVNADCRSLCSVYTQLGYWQHGMVTTLVTGDYYMGLDN